jgi:enoyl-CoA hydratase
MLTPDEALACGLIDEVVTPGEVVRRAIALAAELASLPQQTYRRTRALTRSGLGELFKIPAERVASEIAGGWITDETRAQMAAALGRKPR